MKAFTMLGVAVCLAMLTSGPLSADDKDWSLDPLRNFGQDKLQREAADLQLKLEEGKVYRWIIEGKPHVSGHFSSPGTEGHVEHDKSKCKHEAEAKVTKVSGDDLTLTFTYDASKCEMCKEHSRKLGRDAPGKLIYNVRANKKGEVLSFRKDETSSGGQGLELENMLKTQTRQLLGHGLREARLEPGKSYDVVWMHPESWKMGSDQSSGSVTGRDASTKAGSIFFELRYDGRTNLDDEKVVRFTIAPVTGSFSSPGDESTTGDVVTGIGREAGYAGYRLEDGLLERFAFVLPSAIIKEMHKSDGEGQEQGGMHGDMLITIRRIR
jgi:hypothetical protein